MKEIIEYWRQDDVDSWSRDSLKRGFYVATTFSLLLAFLEFSFSFVIWEWSMGTFRFLFVCMIFPAIFVIVPKLKK